MSDGVQRLALIGAKGLLRESLSSLQRCNFVCLYVMDRQNDMLLGLMILYQLLRELQRMYTTSWLHSAMNSEKTQKRHRDVHRYY